MKIKLMLSAAVALPALSFASVPAALPGVDDIVASLRATDCYHAEIDFSVTLPQASDDVVYRLDVAAQAAPADPLAPADYLIKWKYISSPSEPVEGFSAYFDGHHYRYSPGRLQEYHTQWDSIPFTQGATSVQHTAQFVNLLPWSVADAIDAAADDSRYTLTVRASGDDVLLKSVMEIDGVECQSVEYRFDSADLRLKRSLSENNPGSIAEQTVTAAYTYPSAAPDCQPITEDALANQFADAFGRYRESNFRIENLPGLPLPEIALPTSTRERYIHHRGEAFRAPTVVVLLDPQGGFARETVASVRAGADNLPFAADVIWACTGTDTDSAEEAVGALRPGEHLLVNAARLARDCGAASLPVIIMTRRDGIVGDVALGFNKDLDKIVIQKMTLISQ